MLRPWNHICKSRSASVSAKSGASLIGRLVGSRGGRSASRRRTGSRSAITPATESLETRQLLAATPIAGLSDEFDDAATTDQWQRVNEVEGWNADQLNIYDIDATQPGRMVQQPNTVVWYQNYRGPMAFQTVTGDFSFTTQIHITDRDDIGGSDANDVPGDSLYSLAGAMLRTPRDITDALTEWTPGSMADDGTNNGENYIFLSAGYGTGNPDEFALEVKTTRNSDSQLELTPLGPDTNTVNVQLARIGNSVIALYQLPGEEWQVHRRYSRPDMPETMQVGLVTYTDWEKANDFDPFTQNSTVLVPGVAGDPTPGVIFNPDLTAGFEYARYATPDVPAALAGADLTDPNAVSDAELLSFLGDNTNIIDPGPPVTTGSVTGTVFDDRDGNESQTSDEPGLPGVTIYADINLNGAIDDSEPAVTTNAAGQFELANLAFGTHEIRVVLPDGFETASTDGEVVSIALTEDAVLATATFGLSETVTDHPTENPDAPNMAVGMNLMNVNDWTHSWVFRDAFKLARTFTTRSVNTTTYEFGWNGPPEMDGDGWVTSIPADTINDNGESISYFADSILFSEGGNPVGTYRAEWSGEGEITFGATPIETGTTEDGRSYALLDVAEDQSLHIRINDTNPDDYIRDIQVFMPDYEGQSLEMQDWQPGNDESPFHPLFLERLQPFDTLRFMQWQQVNEDDRDVLTAADLRPVTHANQGSTDRSSFNGVSVEHQVQLANELGANAYFNMPHQADDSYVQAFAEYVRDNIHEDAEVFVEYSNEVWNYAFGFSANAWIGEQQELPENEGLSFVDVWAQEARRDFSIWSEVFSGQEDRLTRVAAGQQSNPWLTGQLLEGMNGEFDAVSSTSYAGLGSSNIDWMDETTTQDDIIDWVLENSVPYSLQTQAAHVELADQYSESLGRDISFVTYEGGSHLDAFGTPYQDLVHSVQDNPRFAEVYAALLNGMEELDVDMHTQYVFTSQGEASPWGEFGVLHEMDTPLEDAHEYNALVDFINGDLDAPTVAVSNEATDAVAHETGDPATFTVTRTDALALADLTVNYEVSGTATSGTDYTALTGTVVIPAGAMSAEIVVTPLLDSTVSGDEGNESIVLTLLDGEGYEAGAASAEATLIDNETFTIDDQTMSHTQDSLQIALPSELGGQPVTHSVRIVQNLAADLNADHNFFLVLDPNFAFNWGGQQERWIQGDGGYYFILPTGEFSLWQGGFDSSQLLGTLDVSYYDNPALITTAESLPVQLSITDNVLTIDPAMTFVGDFDVELTTTVSGVSSPQTFRVDVTNETPTISPLSDITMSAGSTQVVDLIVSDLDNDEVTITASMAGSADSQLVEEFGLYGEQGDNDWGFNWGGQQERWLRGDGDAWFFLLPDGSVNRWQGSFESSEQVGSVSTEVYNNPQLLLDGEDPVIDVAVVNGQLEITSASQIGTFEVTVEVSDPFTTTTTTFEVTVTNEAPELDLDNIDLAAGETVEINLPMIDADGQAISYEVEIIDPSLPQFDIDFVDQGSFYTNYLGNNERWLRDSDGQWYFVLEDGNFYRWDDSFEASELLAELGSDYYEDPNLLLEPPALAVTATIENGVLFIASAEGYVGVLEIRVTASDGYQEVTTSFQLNVVADADDDDFEAVDDVYAAWDLLEV
jgi:hypothetical protein